MRHQIQEKARRAVAYVRVSNPKQISNGSLRKQKIGCREYCQRLGIEIDRVFEEKGASARTTNRPQFQQLLRYCCDNEGRIDFVVVYNLARFSRNIDNYYDTKGDLARIGIAIRSATELVDETPEGKRREKQIIEQAQYEVERRAVRAKAGLRADLKAGRWPYQAPLGYCKRGNSSNKPTLIPDPERAALVRRAFELIETGRHTEHEALRIVSDEGLRTVRGGKPLTLQTFRRLLRNPIYAGWVESRGIRTRGNFEPLVTEETFNRVQTILGDKRSSRKPYQKHHPDFPLRRFVRCGHCNGPLTASNSTNRKGGRRFGNYRCWKCGKTSKPKVEVERAFEELLGRLQVRPEFTNLFNGIVRHVCEQRHAKALLQVSDREALITRLIANKNKLVEAFVDLKSIDQATYQQRTETLDEKIRRAQLDANEARSRLLDVEALLRFAEDALHDPARFWRESLPEQKHRFQDVIFPEGVIYSGAGFEDAATCLYFNLQQPRSPIGTHHEPGDSKLEPASETAKGNPPVALRLIEPLWVQGNSDGAF